MRDFIVAAKALADHNRARILVALLDRELCVCQLTELLELAPSTISKHMSILRQAYLVDSRKDGRWVYYRRAKGDLPPAVQAALEWVDGSLVGDPALGADRQRLEKILKIPLEKLCSSNGNLSPLRRP